MLAAPVDRHYLDVEPLFEEELLLVMSADNDLALKEEIAVGDIQGRAFVLLDETHCLSGAIVSFCRQRSFQPVSVERTSQLATVEELVALGHGVSLIPQMARKLDDSDRRIYRSLCDPKPTRQIVLAWNPYRFQSRIVDRFKECVRRGEALAGRSKRAAGHLAIFARLAASLQPAALLRRRSCGQSAMPCGHERYPIKALDALRRPRNNLASIREVGCSGGESNWIRPLPRCDSSRSTSQMRSKDHGQPSCSRRRIGGRAEGREIEALLFRTGDEGGRRRRLVVAKNKISPAQIGAAKKKSGGSALLQGFCSYADGKFIFELAKEPPGTMGQAIRTIVKRDAEMTIGAVCRRGTDPELAAVGGDGASMPAIAKPHGAAQLAAAQADGAVFSLADFKKSQASWAAAKTKIHGDMLKLSATIQADLSDDPELGKELVEYIDEMLTSLDKNLASALDAVVKAGTDADRKSAKAGALGVIDRYQKTVAINPGVKQVEKNPMMPISILKPLIGTLDIIKRYVSA